MIYPRGFVVVAIIRRLLRQADAVTFAEQEASLRAKILRRKERAHAVKTSSSNPDKQ